MRMRYLALAVAGIVGVMGWALAQNVVQERVATTNAMPRIQPKAIEMSLLNPGLYSNLNLEKLTPQQLAELNKLRQATDLKVARIMAEEQTAIARICQPGLDANAIAQPRLDNLSELSEAESLRLQMLLDRRAKAMEALSNIMKKLHETSQTIIENMK
jgi:hypothetical protein